MNGNPECLPCDCGNDIVFTACGLSVYLHSEDIAPLSVSEECYLIAAGAEYLCYFAVLP